MDCFFQLAHLNLVESAAPPWQHALTLLWAFVLGHALADFPLQGEFLAVGKDRHANLSKITGGKVWPKNIWLYCLSIHAFVHASLVWLISGSVVLSLVEFVLHWVIDLAKSEGWTSFSLDQTLHLLCKVAYAWLIYLGVSWI